MIRLYRNDTFTKYWISTGMWSASSVANAKAYLAKSAIGGKGNYFVGQIFSGDSLIIDIRINL